MTAHIIVYYGNRLHVIYMILIKKEEVVFSLGRYICLIMQSFPMQTGNFLLIVVYQMTRLLIVVNSTELVKYTKACMIYSKS